jgi:Uma2 family endonuclease
MARAPSNAASADVYYPDSSGRLLPLGETPAHFRNRGYLVEQLQRYFADDPQAYVAGNMAVYYVRGDRNCYLTPDVLVVRGIPQVTVPERRRYLTWEEGKSPDVVIELTCKSSREEDIDDKTWLYRDVLGVPEYFLFDPYRDYLEPPLQGYRLIRGGYQPIAPVAGRLPSEGLGLHLEADGVLLRLYDPATHRWLPTPAEEHQARLQAEAEVERLRRELEELRRQLSMQP